MMKKKETLTLALCIALLPPIWAVAAPYIGVTTGAVSLICAGLCAANGDKRENALPISIGFLLGDLWAVCALFTMEKLQWNPDAELFTILFILGGAAVLLSSLAPKWIFCPAWLCGWAIELTVLPGHSWAQVLGLSVQVAAAMLVGVWYVGVFLNIVQKKLLHLFDKKKKEGAK